MEIFSLGSFGVFTLRDFSDSVGEIMLTIKLLQANEQFIQRFIGRLRGKETGWGLF